MKNTGDLKGDEVAQVYVRRINTSNKAPLLSLAGFKRVTLAADETIQVAFALDPSTFSKKDDKGERVIEPGRYEISVGGGQPDKAPGVKTIFTLE